MPQVSIVSTMRDAGKVIASSLTKIDPVVLIKVEPGVQAGFFVGQQSDSWYREHRGDSSPTTGIVETAAIKA